MENMHSINSGTFTGTTFLFLISLLISVGLINVGAILNPTNLYHNCTTFVPSSLYQSNLNTVLSSLSSSAEASREFHNASSGGVYGLFLCRGDVNATACRDCVTFATRNVVKRCPVEKQAMLWYDECQLRYSNRSFFGTVDELPRISLLNTANVTQPDQDRFSRLLNATMKEAAAEAARGGPGEKKFATKEADFNGFQKLYNLAQCTADLAAEDCGRCLADAIGRLPICCAGKLGGRVLFPSCNVRYEFYPFYSQTAPSQAPAAAPPPGFFAGGKGIFSFKQN